MLIGRNTKREGDEIYMGTPVGAFSVTLCSFSCINGKSTLKGVLLGTGAHIQ